MARAHVLSVNVGRPAPNRATSPRPSGIDKRPAESIEVRAPGSKRDGLGSGVVGDFIGERKYHGGDEQAVYLVAREELAHWGAELGRDLSPGMFGENVTTEGIEIDTAVVGTRLQAGPEVVLRVCGPRVPCATFAAHMGERSWVRRFALRGMTGAYCAVEVPGTVRPGQPITVLEAPDHGVDSVMVFRALMGDLESAERVLTAEALGPEGQAALRRKVSRRAGRTAARP